MLRWLSKDRVEYWSFVAQIFGAIGVIASVIYLGAQLGANTNALKTQTYYNTIMLAQRPFEMLVADRDLAKVVETGENDPDTLSADEWKVFCGYVLLEINAWEYAYNLDRSGEIPPAVA